MNKAIGLFAALLVFSGQIETITENVAGIARNVRLTVHEVQLTIDEIAGGNHAIECQMDQGSPDKPQPPR
ncbi:hypothetical protein SAE02_74710 [Skermanella aerolata]|uniref:Uncharacterized protein n=1 Tax=Skermanella aerolata TaxID=393310 RepID=A0A512E3L5_9PROT|nr:hypothetical protein [Skermanella aerolata]KJB89868.1 hypothetical protein N826_12790 [Skermanella aerolata KACC 11604]GEO43323.1 hypothetical protein SAE02_74710 [Skermanella aerolata]